MPNRFGVRGAVEQELKGLWIEVDHLQWRSTLLSVALVHIPAMKGEPRFKVPLFKTQVSLYGLVTLRKAQASGICRKGTPQKSPSAHVVGFTKSARLTRALGPFQAVAELAPRLTRPAAQGWMACLPFCRPCRGLAF